LIELKKFKQRLDTLDVFTEDPLSGTSNSRYFDIVDFPEVVSRGKTSFLIGGTPFLKTSTVIKVEVLDANGEPLYVEPIDASYSEAGYKPISIVSYGGEAQGRCKLIIVAELTEYLDENGNTQPIPEQWQGVYNVRWVQEFFLDSVTHMNTEPIKFYEYPTITAEEMITPYVTISGSIGDATFISSSLDIGVFGLPGDFGASDGVAIAKARLKPGVTTPSASDNLIFTEFKPEHVGGIITIPAHDSSEAERDKMSYGWDGNSSDPNYSTTPDPPDSLRNDLELQIVEIVSPIMAKVTGLANISTYDGSYYHFQSSSQANYPFYIPAQTLPNGTVVAQKFNEDGTTDIVTISEDEANNNPPPIYYPLTGSYKSNMATSRTGSAQIEYISASYQETQTLKSYAKINVKGLKTYSGDVHTLKLFVKPSSQAQEMLLAEGKIEEEKKFIKPVGTQQIMFDVGAGTFVDQSFIDDGFSASLQQTPGFQIYASGLESTQPTLSFDESISYKSLKISGSIQGMGDFYKVESTTTMSFVEGQEYVIKFNMHAKKDLETEFSDDYVSSTSASKAKAHIYMSGSSFDDNHQLSIYSNIDTDIFPDSITPGALRGQYSGKRVFGYKMSDDITQTFTDLSEFGIDSSHQLWVPQSPLYFENNFVADKTGDAKLVMYIEAGEFYFSNIEVNVAKETGFNPSEYTFNVPIDKEIEDDVLTFALEMYNPNGEPASLGSEIIRLQSVPTDFSGGNLVIDGNSNLIVGSTFISNVAGSGIELAGVNSGFIRSVGYEGFTSASEAKSAPGFLLFSGSVLPDSQDNYTGVGLELHAGTDSGSMKFHAKGADSIFEVKTPTFFFGKEGVNFVSGANNNIEISASDFHLTPEGNITMSGDITANAGNIGNFQIVDGKLSGSNITLDANSSAVFMTTQPQEYFIDFTPGTGDGESGTNREDFFVKFGPNFGVRNDGILVASGAVIEGVLTSSLGLIANWTIGEDSIHKLTDGTFTGLSSTGDTRFFAGASSLANSGSAPFNVKKDGTISSSKGLIGGWNITPTKIEKTGLFELVPTGTHIISSSNFKVTDAGVVSASSGLIGGFDISNTFISGGNLLMHKDGRIESSDFTSGVKGWRISAEGNGTAEFENATIRGTLSTTTFEKESVNAVGGQLYVANSTVLSSSVTVSDTTMSVSNVTGFSSGEILALKKVTDTGFNTEYIKIESSSRDASADNELQGKIFVVRGYSGSEGSGHSSSSLGDTPGSATTYTEGQVLVSTGKINTGFIRLNANPNDTTTPYMDIVERTGSAIYDIALKTRLGDLSGLSQTQLLGTNPVNAGFGLFAENVFLTGGINASFGKIGGFGIGADAISGSEFFLSGSATGNEFFISSSNFNVKASGDISGSSVLFDGGTIGGWTLSDGEISSGSVSSGKVSLESVTGSLSAFDSNGVKRIFVGIKALSDPNSSTNLLANGDVEANNLSNNTTLQLTSSVLRESVVDFHISASGFVYDASSNLGGVTASLNDTDGDTCIGFQFGEGTDSQQQNNPGLG
tara:strand:+ start:13800 stop:18386 length:4587 start_codon:yes stop_codon:yes gene_type:complete